MVEHRKLGNSGIEIAPLAFGGNVFGWTVDEPTSFQLLDAFAGGGYNLIDTADVYSNWVPGNSGGDSETIIGKWIRSRGNRENVVIATKVGHDMGSGNKGLRKEYILRAAEDSLRRLQTDHIDLYQTHKDDPDTPVEETLEAYDTLVKQGKVRAIGASNLTKERLTESLEVSEQDRFPRYESLQPLYNLYDRVDYESDLEPVCLAHGIGVIPYFSLGAGFLTGKYRSEADLAGRARARRAGSYLNERGFRILDALDTVASDLGSKPAIVALAWLIARPSITAPIASATDLDQLEDLMAAALLDLEPAQIEELNRASGY
ncbi:MAG: aldo/keto reductase [candidate division Zixibacteria bacterium]|nr:aldo/keto reductase [candidate division Zixibacteria bacterium]